MARKKREQGVTLPRFLAVEGPLGTGKSAVVDKWASQHRARRVIDRPDQNPFLPEVFEGPRGRAFSAQMFFLLARHSQQTHLRQGDLFAPAAVSNYVFARDRLYAELMLSPEELSLYNRIYRLLEPRSVRPDILVYLRSRPGPLLERLRARGRHAERAVTLAWVSQLAELYAQYFERYPASRLLFVDVSSVDLHEDDASVDEVIRAIHRAAAGPEGRSELVLRNRA